MSTTDWTRIRELFETALDLDHAQRASFLDGQCDDGEMRREVEELLAADSAEHANTLAIEQPIAAEVMDADLEQALTIKQIGAYRIQRVLGSGGMSTVFLAVQEQPRREVALKTMRLGLLTPAARRRFEYETEVLARLHHPAIAQIYEAGTWHEPLTGQEVPFFAMEHVADARPLTGFVREHGLDLRDALALFLEVCDAVQHGHQLGVIHRDLKPANVLVAGNGRPKVIDFGIARATDVDRQGATLHTQTGHVLGTLQYMAPEQLEGLPDEIDTRVDVYALGVMLYEMLSGQPPFDPGEESLTAFARRVREVEPPLPSRSDAGFDLAGLARDLDWITRQAIAADKHDRYRSVSEFAADIRRFLRNEPVSVGPPGTTYYLRKFIRRNKVLVGGVCAVFVVLILGVCTTTWQMFRAEDAAVRAKKYATRESEAAARARVAADRASRQAKKAETINRFFNEILKFADPAEGRYRSRPDWTIRDALDAASERIDHLAGEPDVEAHVRVSIGSAYKSLEEFAKAEQHLQRAVELRRRHPGPDHLDLAEALIILGITKSRQRDFTAALEKHRAALAIFRKAHGEEHEKVARCLQNIGSVLIGMNKLDAGEQQIVRAVEIYRGLPGNFDRFIAPCLSSLGVIASRQGNIDEGIARLRETLTVYARIDKSWHPFAAITHDSLAQIFDKEKGDARTATHHRRKSLEIMKNAYGDDSGRTGLAHFELAILLQRLNEHEEAEQNMRAAAPIFAAVFKDKPWRAIRAQRILATWLRARGRAGEALAFAKQAYASGLRIGGPEVPNMRAVASEWGKSLRDTGQLEAAETLFRERLKIAQSTHDNLHVLVAKNNIAIVLTRRARLREAGVLLGEILADARRIVSDSHWLHAVFYRSHGVYLGKVRQFERGATELARALEMFEKELGPLHGNVSMTLRNLVELHKAWGKPGEAAKYAARLAGGR